MLFFVIEEAFHFSLDLIRCLRQNRRVCDSEMNPKEVVHERPSLDEDWTFLFYELLAESTCHPMPDRNENPDTCY